eukprot:Colp12_sorted_trinity150504_noHs@23325
MSRARIPTFYNAVYSAANPDHDEKISGTYCYEILTKSGLPKATLKEIWELVDTQKTGSLTKEGLYKALALVAVAQKGGDVQSFNFSSPSLIELPVPHLRGMDTIEETEQLKKSNSNMSLGRRNGSQERLYDLDMVTVCVSTLFSNIAYQCDNTRTSLYITFYRSHRRDPKAV